MWLKSNFCKRIVILQADQQKIPKYVVLVKKIYNNYATLVINTTTLCKCNLYIFYVVVKGFRPSYTRGSRPFGCTFYIFLLHQLIFSGNLWSITCLVWNLSKTRITQGSKHKIHFPVKLIYNEKSERHSSKNKRELNETNSGKHFIACNETIIQNINLNNHTPQPNFHQNKKFVKSQIEIKCITNSLFNSHLRHLASSEPNSL